MFGEELENGSSRSCDAGRPGPTTLQANARITTQPTARENLIGDGFRRGVGYPLVRVSIGGLIEFGPVHTSGRRRGTLGVRRNRFHHQSSLEPIKERVHVAIEVLDT